MEKYLARPGVPHYLYPASTVFLYQNLNLSDPEEYSDTNFKYHQYFANLNNTLSSTTDKPKFYPDNSFPYYKSHQVYRAINTSTPRSHLTSTEQLQNFDSFIHVPTVFSDQQMSGISYHTAVDMPDGIYLYGGLRAMLTDEYEDMLRNLTKNYTIPPENFTMICDYDLPLPLDKEKIESMALKPIRSIRKYMTESKSFRWVCDFMEDTVSTNKTRGRGRDRSRGSGSGCGRDLGRSRDRSRGSTSPGEDGRNIQEEAMYYFDLVNESDYEGSDDDLAINFRRPDDTCEKAPDRSNMEGVSSHHSGPIDPIPTYMMCSSATKLSDRYFFMYGGMGIETEISYPDEMHCVIKKTLVPSDQMWIFDIISCKFRKVDLAIHPTYSAIFPSSIPRFGHTMVSVPLEEITKGRNNFMADFQSPKDGLSGKSSSGGSAGGGPNVKSSTDFSGSTLKGSAITFVMGGYKLSDTGKSFIAMNDLWKCDFFFDGATASNEALAVASPIGDFNLVNDQLSYIIDENGKPLSNVANSPRFTGVFNHSDQINWPTPRGFFTMSLVDRCKLSQYLEWRNEEEEVVGGLPLVPPGKHEHPRNTENDDSTGGHSYYSPLPVKKSVLNIGPNFNFNTNHLNRMSPLAMKGSRSTTSNSTSTDTTQSSSPFTDMKLHTQEIDALKPKVLMLFGGSSIMYTKVVSDEHPKDGEGIFEVFYNRSILGDAWIFDFQSEKWYNVERFMKVDSKIPICGHSMHLSDTSINIIGGIEEAHYDSEVYKPTPVGVYPSQEDEKRTQNVGWENGAIACQKFLDSRKTPFSPVNGSRGYEIDGYKDLKNFYSCFEFNLKYLEWKLVKMYVVYELEYYAPWQQSDNFEKVFSGGVHSVASKDGKIHTGKEEPEILNFRKKLNNNLLFTNVPTFFKDNKVVMFAPDIKLLDLKTNKYVEGMQTVIGNGVSEIYSTNF